MYKTPGIYKITSLIKPERIYIGSASMIGKRWNHHLSNLRGNKHHSLKLQNHYNKYGESDLQFSVILKCEKQELLLIEQYLLDFYHPYFNIYKTVRYSPGFNSSEETNHKRSVSMTGKKHSEEAKKRMSLSMKGKRKSDEHKRKLSLAFKGKKKPVRSEEYRQNISKSKTGQNNPMFGKKPWNKKT